MLSCLYPSRRQIKSQRGFTLAELAVVLIIVGLIIGGVVKGQELIDSARRTAIWREVQSFKAPVYTFQDRYQALPGDLNDEIARDLLGVPGGDGNGVIGGLLDSASVDLAANSPRVNENRHFWNHLTAAGLIPGTTKLSAEQIDRAGNVQFRSLFPSSRVPAAGYSSLRMTSDAGTPTARTAYWLRLHRISGGAPAAPALSPQLAAALDRQHDDGKPNSGAIRAHDSTVEGYSRCRTPGAPDRYETHADNACVMLFELF
ncbi:MAG: prepilin-type N-terminal cleavage/methylation domain-containing protein [Alphaproteobacteria bacterium]